MCCCKLLVVAGSTWWQEGGGKLASQQSESKEVREGSRFRTDLRLAHLLVSQSVCGTDGFVDSCGVPRKNGAFDLTPNCNLALAKARFRKAFINPWARLE